MTLYVFVIAPFVTVIVTLFSPVAHVAAVPLLTAVSPTIIWTLASASVGVAVIVLVALVVVAVYSDTSGANSGVRASDPIASPERAASKGLRFRPPLQPCTPLALACLCLRQQMPYCQAAGRGHRA